MICPKCGAAIEGGYRYVTCPDCGKTFDSSLFKNADKPESKSEPKPKQELATVFEPESTPVHKSETAPTPEAAFSADTEPIHDLSLSSDSKQTSELISAPEPTSIPVPTISQEAIPELEPILTPDLLSESDSEPVSKPKLVDKPVPNYRYFEFNEGKMTELKEAAEIDPTAVREAKYIWDGKVVTQEEFDKLRNNEIYSIRNTNVYTEELLQEDMLVAINDF